MAARDADLFQGVLPFVTTAEARSFREAARRLGVTTSAISKAISRLERELGTRLLHRTSRHVGLTAEGEAFLARCREAVDQVRMARDAAAQAQRAPRGLLRVSLPLPLGRLVILPALPRLLRRHPGLQVQAVITDRFVRFEAEEVDVAVRIGALADSTAVVSALWPVRWCTVASPEYLARHGAPASPGDLERHNCLKFMLPSGRVQEWSFGADAAPLVVRGNLVADHGDSLVAAALAGLGVVQAHDYMVAAEVASGRLVEVLRAHAADGPRVSVLCAPGRQRAPKVRAFIELVDETMGR